MKFSYILPVLQLATATTAASAGTGLVDFGRSIHLGYAPIERLRQSSSKSSKKVFFVEEEVEIAAELAAEVASSVAGKTGKKGLIAGKAPVLDSSMPYFGAFESVKSAKASKVLMPRMANLSYEFGSAVLSKSAKVSEYMSYDYFAGVESKSSKAMSYEFAGSFADVGSMEFELADDDASFASPTVYPTSFPTDVANLSEEEEIGENFEDDSELRDEQEGGAGLDSFGRLVFEYLSQCSGANLDTDSCLVSSTIYYLTSFDISEGEAGLINSTKALSAAPVIDASRSRFLQTLDEDECKAPEITASFLSFILDSSRAQCEGIGNRVTDAEYTLALAGFTTIFDNESCWASLCGESSNPSDLFFKILFAEAARCASVDTSFIPECVLGHIFDVIFTSDDSQVNRIRRSLAKESSSCDQQPSAAELGFFVTFLLTEAEQTCPVNDDNSDVDLELAFDALVKIFGASQCWGVDECSGEDDAITFDDDWMTPVVQMDGTRCDLQTVNASSTKALDLSYYYVLETASSNEEDISASIQGIERQFVTQVCSPERRRLEDTELLSFDPEIIAVDSNPLDTIASDYVCEPKASGANACNVIEGTLSILVPSSQDLSLDNELKEFLYAFGLQDVFVSIMSTVEDPNVISVEYVGNDPSYLASSDSAVASASNSQEDSSTFSSVAIGIGSSLVIVGALIASMKKVHKSDDPMHADEKVDDDSDAQQTSDLTYSNSLDDRSEVSSLSPTNRYCPERAAVVRDTMTKHFVLAEEEEANWVRLGINPGANSQLEVYEEAVDEQSI